jgi:hypothetical protein
LIPSEPIYPPCANLNGTHPDDMCADWRAVMDATHALRDALRKVCPHGRDYQTLPVYAYRVAREEHDKIEREVSALESFSKFMALYWANASDV